MIKIVSRVGNKFRELENIEDDCWVHLGDPNEKEIERVSTVTGIDSDILRAPLDEEESARLDYEDGVNIVIVDIPHIVPTNDGFSYETIPLGIFMTERHFVTVCVDEDSLVEDFWAGKVKDLDTSKKTRFLLQILYKKDLRYLSYLRMIDNASNQLENVLHKSMKNRELIQMLRLNKSLVYFSTSLKGNEVVLEKIMRSNNIIKYEEDSELLEDVITENKQAIEMCGIYMDILTGTMDAFASLVSNNQNTIMKFFAAATILMEIPAIISGIWGMNFTSTPLMSTVGGFYIIVGISALIVFIVGFIFWKKDMF